jgi:hypothetical protein
MLYALWFVLGVISTIIVNALRDRTPPRPSCTAVLKSGEGCVHELGHGGPHLAYVALSPGGFQYQKYCWEDPEAGLHAGGFFYR